MKYRNRFQKYGCNFSANTSAFAEMKNPLMCFGDGDGDGDGGGSDGDGDSDGDKGGENGQTQQGIAMTDSQFKTWMASQSGQSKEKGKGKEESNNRNESAYDRIKAEEQSKVDEKTNESNIRDTVKFEMSFDKFIKDNEKSFDTDVDKFRQGAKGLEGKELQQSLSCTSAKSFFSSKDNLALLPEHEQQYIKNKIIGIADNAVDSTKAWQLLCDAIHIKNRINQNSDFKKNGQSGGHGDNTNTPNVTAYIEKCMARGKSKDAA